jgi:protease prsW family protein
VRRFVHFGDVPDVILAALAVALGFAVTEDAAYLISAATNGTSNAGLVAFVRALSAVPLHVICGLTMGALIGSAPWEVDGGRRTAQRRLVAALVLPVLIHGAYDFLLMLHQRDPTVSWALQALPLVVAVSAMTAITLCNRALRAARQARWSGLPPRAGWPAVLGCVLLLIGMALVALTMLTPGTQAKQGLMVYCIVPLLFGLDLLWTAMGRTRRRAVA